MADELSVGRITNIAKTITTLNISKDFKGFLKEKAEEHIRESTLVMKSQTLNDSPEAKTLADINPHLSNNRVKEVMMKYEKNMRIGSSAVNRARVEAEKVIRKIVKIGEKHALQNNNKTLMRRHLEEIEDEAVIADKYVDDIALIRIAKCYTKREIRSEGITELRLYLENEMEELILGLENGIRSNMNFQELKEIMLKLQDTIDQVRIKNILLKADNLAKDRKKEIIGVNEIVDSF